MTVSNSGVKRRRFPWKSFNMFSMSFFRQLSCIRMNSEKDSQNGISTASLWEIHGAKRKIFLTEHWWESRIDTSPLMLNPIRVISIFLSSRLIACLASLIRFLMERGLCFVLFPCPEKSMASVGIPSWKREFLSAVVRELSPCHAQCNMSVLHGIHGISIFS